MKTARFLARAGVGLLSIAAALGAARAREQVLFAFDDVTIPWRYNLKVTMVPAEKYAGNPVLRPGPAGSADHGHAVLYGTVIKDGDKFRMWYLGMIETEMNTAGQAPGYYRPMCYAESTDGIHWNKPDLGLVEIAGSRHNNACLVEGDPHSLTLVDDYLTILYEPNDPDPSQRYKAAYIAHPPYADIKGGMSRIGWKEARVCSTICVTSADGLRWHVVGDRPANAGGERFEVSSLYKFGKFYYTTGQLLSPWAWREDGSDIGRSMWVYRSPDFATWSQAKAFAFARPGQLLHHPIPGEQTHMGAGLWNRGNVLVGLYGMWQDNLDPASHPPGTEHLWGTRIDLGLVLSDDGIHFREPQPEFKVIRRGGKDDWDNIAELEANAFVNEGDKTMIWYSHWDTGGSLKNMAIGLATVRRDGFGYLSRKQAEEPAAYFITKPIKGLGKGGKLQVNADGLSDQSPLMVELLDDLARPLAGYSGPDAAKVTVSGTRQEVLWPQSGSSELPPAKEFSIKVVLPTAGDARVYSLNVRD